MIALFLACSLIAAAIFIWLLQRWLPLWLAHYRNVFTDTAHNSLGEFFLFLDPSSLWRVNLFSCCGIFLLAYVLSGSPAIAIIGAAAVLTAPRWLLRFLRRRRREQFEQQLPDMLLAMAGALQAGSSIQTALRHIVPETPAPLSQEFGLVLREQRMGVPFAQALLNLYERMPCEGSGLVVSSLNIALHNGGNLAETLERVATTIRARTRLKARVAALTSQGRLQAWIMVSLPLALALVLNHLDPYAMAHLWHSSVGWIVLTVIAILEVIGIFLIRRIVDIQV
ncbi:MAG TPA: type II secretion system F family protein [Pusillimonas sp.]|uniref:type II secretion system F family protein n=1 Tax=unclassified Pusillimonas TaxID=2640016 RepID=UPI002608FA85|nr:MULTISPECIES: type II secretion system F family protein [unclassified Pusillimonas]HLU19407.1 type II secretion system F family protein [Pusillimonas sp.]